MPSHATLQLDFVYGYHGSRCRDNLFYIESDEIVYHIAGLGIVYNPKTHTQRFFTGHDDDIISLTLHPNGRLVATGQIGKEPSIIIWDAITMETVSICRGLHQRGICSLGFSNDGKYLVSVGLDDDHTIALWDWRTGRSITSQPTSKDRIFDIEPSPYSNLIVTAGVKHIKFWEYSGNTLQSVKGISNDPAVSSATILCISFGHENKLTYTGTLTGEIYVWKDNKHVKTIKAHKGPVYSIADFDDGFVTGGKDGILKFWGKDFSPLHTLPMTKFNIRSICWGKGKVLVGTKDSQLLEIVYQKEKSQPVMLIEGHGEGEVWGLATSTKTSQFVTASDDRTIKLWDSRTKRCLFTIQSKTEARCCAFSPDGQSIAVGFSNGNFSVFSTKDARELVGKSDRSAAISALQWSPDGAYLAVGSYNNVLDIYDGKYNHVGALAGDDTGILHVDWSNDNRYVQFDTDIGNIFTYQIPNCQKATKKPNTDWDTIHCIYNDAVKGIWPPFAEKNDVNAVDRNKTWNILATGDDYGYVKLFEYPVPEKTPFKKFTGHTAHVTCVRWINDNTTLLSIGGGDQAVIQWKMVIADDHGEDVEHHVMEENLDEDVEKEMEIDYDKREQQKKVVKLRKGAYHADSATVGSEGAEGKADLPPNHPEHPDNLSADAPVTGLKFKLGVSESVKAGRPSLGYRARYSPDKKPEPGKSRIPVGNGCAKPDRELHLEFIHGYRGFDGRHNLFYTQNGDIAYHTAAVGVVYNRKNHAQKFFIGQHHDDILCAAIHPDGKLMATGQIGKDPTIIVWDTESMAKQSVMSGFHIRGVCALGFSPDGSQVISVGLDDNHSLCVYNWKKGEKIASQNGSKEKIYTALYNSFQPDTIVSVGVKHVCFWKIAGNGLMCRKGVFGKKGELQTMLSLAFDKRFTYTGANSGDIYQWSDNQLMNVIPAHKGPVFDIAATKDGFFSGGKDGILRLWATEMKPTSKTVDLNSVTNPIPFVVRSVFSQNGKILAGSADGAIAEINESSLKAELILGGHGLGELWGLAVHPSKRIFATASDDRTVKLWSLDQKKLLGAAKQEFNARSADFSPDGKLLAIGYDNGSFSVLNGETLSVIHTAKDRNRLVSVVKFAPDGRHLCVGTHDDFVDVYESHSWKRTGKCPGNSSYISHLDWAEDSSVISTNSGAYEYLFYSMPKGTRIDITKKTAATMSWSTYTSILGDNVVGIWPPFSDGTDINSVDVTKTKDVIATADDFGLVKIFKYPAPTEFSSYHEYKGHSSHVTSVKFSYDDQYLVSTGGLDASVFVWRYKQGEAQAEEEVVEEAYDEDIEREKKMVYHSKADLASEMHKNRHQGEEEEEEGKTSVKASAGLTFKKGASESVKASAPRRDVDQEHRDTAVDNKTAPKNIKDLNLEYVHGYRCHDAHDNLFISQSGEVIYHSAAVGIVHDTRTNTQRYFTLHSDDIVSLTYHPASDIVASGQMGKSPMIYIWSASTLELLSTIKGAGERAITALAFSPNGKQLLSIDESDNHTMVLWKWKEGVKVANTTVTKSKVFDVQWNPYREGELVTVGSKHIRFWKVVGNSFEGRNGIYGKVGPQQTMLTVAFDLKGNAYSGAVSGDIYQWSGNSLTAVIPAHAGPVYVLTETTNSDILSGGKDNTVIRWNVTNGFTKKEGFNLPVEPTRGTNALTVRSIAESKNNIVIGTATAELYEVGADKRPRLMISGHGDGELWGLATHPSRNIFATCSDDATLRVWDIAKRAIIQGKFLGEKARSVAYTPDGNQIAVGFINGSFGVYNTSNLEELVKKRNRKEMIGDIKFSPDGRYLAVGSNDNFVDFYQTTDWKLLGTCKGNSSFIVHMDFNKDSNLLTTASGAYEQLLYDVPSGRQVVSGVKDRLANIQDWYSWTSVLGENVAGVFPKYADHTDVNSLEVSNNCQFMATGDDFGFVKMFAYPCQQKGAPFKKFVGHSAHVTNVRFTHDDGYVISIGGGDRSVFVWKKREQWSTCVLLPCGPADQYDSSPNNQAFLVSRTTYQHPTDTMDTQPLLKRYDEEEGLNHGQPDGFTTSSIHDPTSSVLQTNQRLIDILERDESLSEKTKEQKERTCWSKFIHFFKIHKDLHVNINQNNWFSRLRKRMGVFIESNRFQFFILALIVLDVLVLTVELTLERNESQNPNETEEEHRRIEIVEEVLKYTSWSILFTFALEVCVQLFAFGWRFFTHPLYVFDLLIISAAIVVEVILHEEFSGYLILARLWRLLRIIHGIVTTIEERHAEENKKRATMMNRIKQLKHQLEVTTAILSSK
ncbi:echinoderm microtubule-associated protein-like 6 [Planoprotostelium fungivorum]|uniref:Echinoderm microtubule-associated protein-like 6 n=1 Tax=Planoprotostelium fungivorum TaxID=1890364 RepID=A0A2P6NXB8_9EUKA|nr:echinoderm microtubule-associated protein-like 6 [Planoprotostelium fungivorum]